MVDNGITYDFSSNEAYFDSSFGAFNERREPPRQCLKSVLGGLLGWAVVCLRGGWEGQGS